ncbi:MAG TPA: 16S rRNA (guanine(966)-N(2))-methyltransferase RsmD [Burkholderiales bacterium]|nr:16S rRNA (guanine(966)-N(2))-methyltransferase RsmD [Burkholderiales bacterium]
MPAAPRRLQRKPRGRVRIVGGTWRSRLIEVQASRELRPTPDRVRETLFNWLGQDLSGLVCLDLFAGSGVLGFEAASRGAARVVMVERERETVAMLRANRAALGAQQVEVVPGDAFEYLARSGERFDVVFLDPPFRQNALPAALAGLASHLRPAARVYLEAKRPLELRAPWKELRGKRAGQVSYQLIRWSADDTSRLSGDV